MWMDTFYTLEKSNKPYGKYIGSDPNYKYQKCIILKENKDTFNVLFPDSRYLEELEITLNKKDVFIN